MAKQEELQRQVAARAKLKAQETVDKALMENASTNVLSPAREAEKLTDAVSTSLGPPVSPAVDTDVVVNGLNTQVAKHNIKVDKFADANDKNAGKKIEGTGWLQIPYFVWLAIVGVVVLVVWHLLKLVIEGLQAYPPTAVPATVAVGGLHVAESVAGKALKQVVAGGQAFKTWIGNEIKDTDLKEKILSAFRANHDTAQDEDVQTLVKGIK